MSSQRDRAWAGRQRIARTTPRYVRRVCHAHSARGSPTGDAPAAPGRNRPFASTERHVHQWCRSSMRTTEMRDFSDLNRESPLHWPPTSSFHDHGDPERSSARIDRHIDIEFSRDLRTYPVDVHRLDVHRPEHAPAGNSFDDVVACDRLQQVGAGISKCTGDMNLLTRSSSIVARRARQMEVLRQRVVRWRPSAADLWGRQRPRRRVRGTAGGRLFRGRRRRSICRVWPGILGRSTPRDRFRR